MRKQRKNLLEAHKIQTELLQGEMQGNPCEFSLLLVHSQNECDACKGFSRTNYFNDRIGVIL